MNNINGKKKIVITGGAGFLGQKLAQALIANQVVSHLILVDIIPPPKPSSDGHIIVDCIAANLSEQNQLQTLITPDVQVVYHLAAIVSGQAENEFDLGMQVNFEITHQLLETIRQVNPRIRCIFSSSLAVFGGKLPPIIDDMTATTPSSSYGTQKAMCELLIRDYSRKGFVDGIILRLPTISVRPGKPNQAASSFISGIIREPLNGEPANCPVSTDLNVWISSPHQVIENLCHAMTLKPEQLALQRLFNLPGISVSIQAMIEALSKHTSAQTSALISYTPDANIQKIVGSWPSVFNVQSAIEAGFKRDQDIDFIISQYISDTK